MHQRHIKVHKGGITGVLHIIFQNWSNKDYANQRSSYFDLLWPKNQKHDEQKFIRRKSFKITMETKQEKIINMQVQQVSTFLTKNLTLAIAWRGKNNVFVVPSMPCSQLMVPRRERWDQRFLGGIFAGLFLYQTIKSTWSMKSYFNHQKQPK